jgi:AraC family transcriptional regulator, arabinose operon regulatory protein
MENLAIKVHSGYRRRVRYNEKYYVHGYEYDSFIPPLCARTVGVSRFREGDFFKNINRKIFSMNIITLGNAYWEQNGMKGTLIPGDVFLAHTGKNQYFAPGSEDFVHKRFIIADGTALDMFLQSTGLAGLNWIRPIAPQKVVALFRKAYRIMAQKPEGFVLELSLILHQILVELGRSIVTDYPVSIRNAIEYIRRNLNQNLDLKTICQKSNLSVRHGTRLFKRHLGMSPMQFMIGLKMEWARNLVSDTAMNIKQIATILGYDDPLYFSLQFRKKFGLSPRQYRQKILSQH